AGDGAAAAQLRGDFSRMAAIQPRLSAVRESIPAANDGLQVAGAMANLSRIGTGALDFLSRRTAPDATWRSDADSVLAALTGRRVNQWLLVPTATDAVRTLVDAAKALSPIRP
ncbi:MAG: hypothetical protein ABUL71_00300, partial [Gemmatimonadota bacterium]